MEGFGSFFQGIAKGIESQMERAQQQQQLDAQRAYYETQAKLLRAQAAAAESELAFKQGHQESYLPSDVQMLKLLSGGGLSGGGAVGVPPPPTGLSDVALRGLLGMGAEPAVPGSASGVLLGDTSTLVPRETATGAMPAGVFPATSGTVPGASLSGGMAAGTPLPEDIAAQVWLGAINKVLGTSLGKVQYIPGSDELGNPVTLRVDTATGKIIGPSYRKAQESGMLQVTSSSGGKGVIPYNKYAPPPYIPTAPPEYEIFRWSAGGKNYAAYRNKTSKEMRGSPWIEGEESQLERQRRASARAPLKVLDEIESLFNKIDLPKTSWERLGMYPRRKFEEYLQTNKNVALVNSMMEGTLAPLVRSLGEAGALSQQDVARARMLLPRVTDTYEVVQGKLNQLREILETVTGNTASQRGLPAAGSADGVPMTAEEWMIRRGLKERR